MFVVSLWAQVTEQVLVVIGRLFYLIPPFKLKNQVNWLTRWLMSVISTKVTPFYISQVIGGGDEKKI